MGFVPDSDLVISPEVQRARDKKALGLVESEAAADPTNQPLQQDLAFRRKALGAKPRFVPDVQPPKPSGPVLTPEQKLHAAVAQIPSEFGPIPQKPTTPPQAPVYQMDSPFAGLGGGLGGFRRATPTPQQAAEVAARDTRIKDAVEEALRLSAGTIGLGPEMTEFGELSRLPLIGERTKAAFGAPGRFLGEALGSKVAPAKQEAMGAVRGAIETGAARQEKAAVDMDALRRQIDTHLEQTAANPPNLDRQGSVIRDVYNKSISNAFQARSAQADKDFATVRAAASKLEATGARPDVSDAVKKLEALKAQASGIPDLEAGLNRMITSIEGRSQVEAPAVNSLLPGGRTHTVRQEAPGKTFEQLELTRRYLNDIAYGGTQEGYSAIIKNAAKDAASAIDQSMQKFLPEFGKYKANYRKMSEPLESLNTKFGKLISSTEGGVGEDVYSKVANADIPGRLFAKKEGIDLLTDALAGGRNASPEVRAKAASQVDKMVGNWLMKSLGEAKPGAALEKLKAPGMEAATAAVPKVAGRIGRRLEGRAQLAGVSEELKAGVEPVRKQAEKFRENIDTINTLASSSSKQQREEAFKMAVSTMARMKSSGVLSPNEYSAAQRWIDNAVSVEEKHQRALKILKWTAIGGATAAGIEGYNILGGHK